MHPTFNIASFDAVCQLYAQFLTTFLPHLRPCPLCGQAREVHSYRFRALQWAADHLDPIALTRLRCRPCHTVETLFPPWILPYELAALWILEAAVTAVAVDGQSLQQTATRWHWTLAWIRAHVRPWLAVSVEFRTLVAQWGHGVGLVDLVPLTWRPPATAVAGDWAWLCVAWVAVGLRGLGPELAQTLPGWVVWRSVAPEVLPAAPIPATTHLGRRVREHPPSPP